LKIKKYINIIFIFLASIFVYSCSDEKPKNVAYSFEVAKDVKLDIADFHKVEFNSDNNLNLGFYKGNLWIKLEIDNSDTYRTLMFTNNDLFNRNYAFYKLDSSSIEPVLIEKISNNLSYDNRTFNNSYPNFKIDLQPNEKATYIITSQSDGRSTDASPKLITLEEYNSIVNQNIIWSIVFLSSVIALLILNVYLWNLHKHKLYAYYIFYILASLFMYTGFDGYFYKFNFSQLFIDHTIFLSVRIWVLSFVIFTTKFLDIKKINPRIYKYSMIVLIVILGGSTLYEFVFYNTSVQYLHYYENILSFFYLLLIFRFLLVSIKLRKQELKYYLIALSFFLTFIIIGLIDGHFQVFPSNPFVYIKIGTLIEFIGFTYFMTILIKQKFSMNEKLERELSKNRSILQEKEKLLASNASLVSVFKLIENSFSSNSDWNDFKERFKTLDPNFITSLLTKHSDLSKSEIRLLTLIRIGYSQKEIATILNITPESVKKARSRARKKLDLEETQELNSYLQML
jgi:DNA-binding CsgD family transcriptional regulator